MIFTIPCHVFVRASRAALQPKDPDGTPPYPGVRSVRIEHYEGVSMAIATNRHIASFERIGNTDQPNGGINVSLDLVKPCERFIDTDMNLMITQSPGWSVAQIGVDYFHPANAEVYDKFPDWRLWVPEPAKTTTGALGFDAEAMQLLADITPTGCFVLPRNYDASKPIVVRDWKDDSWFGIFLSLEHKNQSFKPAVIPDWFKP